MLKYVKININVDMFKWKVKLGYLIKIYIDINKSIVFFIINCIVVYIVKFLGWFNNFFDLLFIIIIVNVNVNKLNVKIKKMNK